VGDVCHEVARILLGRADVVADDAREVDRAGVEVGLVGHRLGGERLAGPARTREERADAGASSPAGSTGSVAR
jgi:hypothetical protein